MAAVEKIVTDTDGQEARNPDNCHLVGLIEGRGGEGKDGKCATNRGSWYSKGAAIGPLELRPFEPQPDVAEHDHGVRKDRSKDGHVDQGSFDVFAFTKAIEQEQDGQPDQRSENQGSMGGLVLRGLGDPTGKIACPREGEENPSVSVDDHIKTGDQASDGDQVEGVGGDPIFKHGLEPIGERGGGGTDQDGAAFNACVEDQGKDGKA